MLHFVCSPLSGRVYSAARLVLPPDSSWCRLMVAVRPLPLTSLTSTPHCNSDRQQNDHAQQRSVTFSQLCRTVEHPSTPSMRCTASYVAVVPHSSSQQATQSRPSQPQSTVVSAAPLRPDCPPTTHLLPAEPLDDSWAICCCHACVVDASRPGGHLAGRHVSTHTGTHHTRAHPSRA
jgi:hypothetical protein